MAEWSPLTILHFSLPIFHFSFSLLHVPRKLLHLHLPHAPFPPAARSKIKRHPVTIPRWRIVPRRAGRDLPGLLWLRDRHDPQVGVAASALRGRGARGGKRNAVAILGPGRIKIIIIR